MKHANKSVITRQRHVSIFAQIKADGVLILLVPDRRSQAAPERSRKTAVFLSLPRSLFSDRLFAATVDYSSRVVELASRFDEAGPRLVLRLGVSICRQRQ